MPPSIHIDDIPDETRKRLGLKKTRRRQFTAEQTRAWSLRVLAQMAELTQDQRRRVLEHALKLNRV